MSVYTPDKWVVVKIEGKDVPLTYKVFACWYGGFLNGDSWKLNSGITKVTQEKNYFLFQGFSGSTYKCHKKCYGTHMYGEGVLQGIIERSLEVKVNVEVLSAETKWVNLLTKNYAVFHKPTKTWVYFRKENSKEPMICLTLKPDATVSSSKEKLKQLLLSGNFNSIPYYGKENFLEFQIKTIK